MLLSSSSARLAVSAFCFVLTCKGNVVKEPSHTAFGTLPGLRYLRLQAGTLDTLHADFQAPDIYATVADASNQADNYIEFVHKALEISTWIIENGPQLVEMASFAKAHIEWLKKHEAAAHAAVRELNVSFHAIQGIYADWQREWRLPARSGAAAGPPRTRVSDLPRCRAYILFCFFVLIVVVFVSRKQPFDVFAVSTFSRKEMTIAFMLACKMSVNVIDSFDYFGESENPLSLWFAQVAVCFISVSMTVPVLIGSNKGAPRWLVLTSVAITVWFMIASSGGCNLCMLWQGGPHKPHALVVALVSVTLNVLLFLAALRRAAFACGRPGLKPFYERFSESCHEYVRARLDVGRALNGTEVELPVFLPTALLAPVMIALVMLIVIAGVVALTMYRYLLAVHTYLIPLLGALMRPLETLLAEEGIVSRDLETVKLMFTYQKWATASALFLALVVSGCFAGMMLRDAVSGYRSLFRKIARGTHFVGKVTIRRRGHGRFHPQWSTYLSGALIGNVILAFVFNLVLLAFFFLLVSLPQFWMLQWSMRRFYMLCFLSWLTRAGILRFLVPHFVLSDTGVLLNARVWTLLYPTLMIMNFILGASSGLLRFLVMFPLLVNNFFRVDSTMLPESLCEYDFAYHPFLSLTLHGHRTCNPIMAATVDVLMQGRSIRSAHFSGSSFTWRSAPVAQQHTEELALHRSVKMRRAVARWHLALLLIRNPGLKALRWHSQRSAQRQQQEEVELSCMGFCSTKVDD